MAQETDSPRALIRPTIADVARASGVSGATVSYVLNNTEGQSISLATRERVLAAAAALGYNPSAAAAALRRGHSNLVIIVKDAALSGYVTEPFLAGIIRGLRAAGHTPLVVDIETEVSLLALVREISPFGVVALTPITPEASEAIRGAGVRRLYRSIVDRDAREGRGERPWEEEIGLTQARYLLARGCERLVYAAPPADSPRHPIAMARAAGVDDACRLAGAPTAIAMTTPADRGDAAELLARLVSTTPGTLGVCAFDDLIGSVVVAAAADLSIDVPAQLSVIGVDNNPFAALTSPPLTTIRVDAERSAARIVTQFLTDAGGAVAPEGTLLPIARGSTKE